MCTATRLLDQEFTQKTCCELLPEWKGIDVRITQLKGGITNKLYRIQSEKGDHTVRIYGDKTDLFINRDYEAQAIQEMAKIGVCSNMVKYLPETGVTIVEFIDDAIVLKNSHFLDKSLYPKIVEPIRKIHTSGVNLEAVFNPLVEVMKMSAILKRLDADYPEFDIAGTVERLIKLSSIINIPESEYCACHNDLLADNFILIKEDAEILVPRKAEKEIVEEYCAGYKFNRVLYLIDLFKPFPDIYWFLWSLIQLNISKIKFDYYSYGKTKYHNAIGNLEFIKNEYGVVV
jgi:thiamine kinase-like enzyme